MNRLETLLGQRRVALVVYDMQVGILSQIEGGELVVSGVRRLLQAARGAGIPTFFSRHLSLPKPLMGRFAMRQAMAWQRTNDPEKVQPWFLRDAPGTAILPELAPTADEMIVDKIAMSAFEGTFLGMAMRDLGLDAFIVCGVATEIGIEPTVRHATDLGFIPIVALDACGAGHPEAAARSVEGMRFTGDAILSDVATLCGLLEAVAQAQQEPPVPAS